MTMRAVWWLLKLGWRTATRVRRALGLEPPGTHPTEWLMSGPLYDDVEPAPATHAPELEHPALEREARELAGKLARSRGRR